MTPPPRTNRTVRSALRRGPARRPGHQGDRAPAALADARGAERGGVEPRAARAPVRRAREPRGVPHGHPREGRRCRAGSHRTSPWLDRALLPGHDAPVLRRSRVGTAARRDTAKVLAVETKRIVNDIRAAAAGTGLDHPKAHVSWSPLELDREGYEEVAELLGGVLEKLHDIQARSNGRQAEKAGRRASRSRPRSRSCTSSARAVRDGHGRPSSAYFGCPMRMWLPNGSRRPQSVP